MVLSYYRDVAFEFSIQIGFAFDSAGIGVNAWQAEIAFVASVPTFIDVLGFVHQLAPTGEYGDVELFDVLSTETELVVLAIIVGREYIRNKYVGFTTVDINAVDNYGVAMFATDGVCHC